MNGPTLDVAYGMFALSPIDPIAWQVRGDWYCADHGSTDTGESLDPNGRVMLRAELGADDYYGCEECGRSVLYQDVVAAPADVIRAATMAGWSAEETTTGGNCEGIVLTRDGYPGEILITDGDAGLPDGGWIMLGAYAEDGSAPDDVALLPHDMVRLARALWLLAIVPAEYHTL